MNFLIVYMCECMFLYQMQSSSTQGCHLSCHSESPCQQPVYHPKRKILTMPAAIQAYENTLKKNLTLLLCWIILSCMYKYALKMWLVWFVSLVPRYLLGGVFQPPAADLLAQEDPLSGQDL